MAGTSSVFSVGSCVIGFLRFLTANEREMTRKEFEEIECLRVGSCASRLNLLIFEQEGSEKTERRHAVG